MTAADLEDPPAVVASACDTVFQGILRALETRRMMPGQRLVEVDLAASYGVSRNSVREALQRLSADGIVDLVRNKGAVIRLLALQETMDVLEVAERILGLLARTAARAINRGAEGRTLRQSVKQLGSTLAGGDAEAFAAARRAYYRAMFALSGNRELRRLVPVIQMPVVYAQHPLQGLSEMRLRDYRAIAKAVLNGDENAADLAGMVHVENIRSAILKVAKAGVPS